MVALALVLGAGTGWAGVITISDNSFESPGEGVGAQNGYLVGTGWAGYGSGGAVLNPSSSIYYNYNSSYYVAGVDNGYVPNGNQVGVSYSGGGLYQQLSATVVANQIYTLTGYVGNNANYHMGNGAMVYLLAGGLNGSGGTVLASETITTPTSGTFASWSISYTSHSSLPSGDLYIELGGPTSGGDADYDNIQLSYSPVPEPVDTALIVFGILMVGGTVGRRFVALRNSPEF